MRGEISEARHPENERTNGRLDHATTESFRRMEEGRPERAKQLLDPSVRRSFERAFAGNDSAEKDINKNKPEDAKQRVETNKDIAEIAYKNKIDGCRREDTVEGELKKKYPESGDYRLIKEAYLRDKGGHIVKDTETGQARRIDFVAVKDGKVVDSVEVTSKTAPKEAQSAKEERIRENGGNYIKDPTTGEIIRMPASVHTRIDRRD